MKKIPATYHLDESDIKNAIQYWLEQNENISLEDFDIKFKVVQKFEHNYGGPPGGNDPIEKTIITASVESKC